MVQGQRIRKMRILIKNGRVIDPANKMSAIKDILIENSKISKVSENIKENAERIIDAKDKIVIPGIVDMHAHLREPGREDKETIASASSAGFKGGVTSVLAMPNTSPCMDSPENIKLLKDIINKNPGCLNIFIAGAITIGREGEELVDIAKLKKEGVVAITDDGNSVDSEGLLLEALKKAKENKILVMCHSEDKSISGKGVINLGIISTKLGLRPMPKEAEYKRIERDIELAKKINASIHITHISCKESVEIIKKAKEKGIKVTCDATPHHFSLTQEDIAGYNTNMKMNPPLRTKEDVEAIKKGLKDAVIDAIASDHAPHTENEKEVEFDYAEFGTIGLETELAVSITELIKTKILDWPQLIEKLSVNPARILGIDKGSLKEGKEADLAIIDPEKEWVVKENDFLSKSKNSAFIGRKLSGKNILTICKGNIVYDEIHSDK